MKSPEQPYTQPAEAIGDQLLRQMKIHLQQKKDRLQTLQDSEPTKEKCLDNTGLFQRAKDNWNKECGLLEQQISDLEKSIEKQSAHGSAVTKNLEGGGFSLN